MLLDIICFGLYSIAAAIIVTGLFDHHGPKKRLALPVAGLALVFHGFILFNLVILEPGQNMSMLNVASLVSWLISVTMVLASFKLPNTILLPVVFSFSALVILVNPLLPDENLMHYSIQPALIIHITFALLAYACLSIAF